MPPVYLCRRYALGFVAVFSWAGGPRRWRVSEGGIGSLGSAATCKPKPGGNGGSNSLHICIATRSSPTWKITVDPGPSRSPGPVVTGNGSTLWLLFFFIKLLAKILGRHDRRDCRNLQPELTSDYVGAYGHDYTSACAPKGALRDVFERVSLAVSALRSDPTS